MKTKTCFGVIVSIITTIVLAFSGVSYCYATGDANTGGSGGDTGAIGSAGSYFTWHEEKSGNGTLQDDATDLHKAGELCKDDGNKGHGSLVENSVAMISLRHTNCNGWVGETENGQGNYNTLFLNAAGNYAPYQADKINANIMNSEYNNYQGKIEVCYENEAPGTCGNFASQNKFWLKLDGNPVTAAWVWDYPVEVSEEEDPRTIIEVVETPDDPEDPTPIDDRDRPDTEIEGDHNRWLYEYGKTESQYGDRTDPNEGISKDYKYRVKATTKKIKYKHTWKEMRISKKKIPGTDVYTWTCLETNKYSKTFTYELNTPEIKPERYDPWNLNTNALVTVSDKNISGLDSSFIGGKGIAAYLDNGRSSGGGDQSKIDEQNANAEPLSTLDINSDKTFTFRFKEGNPFGMPGLSQGYNWDNPTRELTNGTWEYTDYNLPYCNGLAALADSDGYIRSDLTFRASIDTPVSGRTSSLIKWNGNDGEEKMNNEEFKYVYKNGTEELLGDWSARFSLADTFKTDNQLNKTDFRNWWVNTYNMKKFFEYGVEYKGKITTSGIHNPSLAGGYQECDYIDEGDYGRFYTDTEKEQRSLYTGCISKKFQQPVLYGEWEVRTLAGDVI